MTAKEITTYLKYAVDLESSVYRQQEAIEMVQEDMEEPKKAHIWVPIDPSRNMKMPAMPEKRSAAAIFFKGLGVSILCITISIAVFEFSALIGLLSMFVGGSVLVVAMCKSFLAAVENQDNAEWYSKAVREYEENEKKKEKYDQEMKAYYQKVKKAEEKYERDNENYRKLKKSLAIMEPTLQETQQMLAQLYEKNVIFPKYRNMIAMCTFYEYFASGRCTELTGPTGAYNLYEAELRQNLIIGHLDSIHRQLDQIKANQYTLYQQIERSNQLLDKIGDVLETSVEVNRITAHCMAEVAENTEAIKYLNLIR